MTDEFIPIIDYFTNKIIKLTKETEGRRIHNENLLKEYEKIKKENLDLQQEIMNLKEQNLLLAEGKII